APWRGNRHQPLASSLTLKPGEVSERDAWQRLTLEANTAKVSSMSVFLRGRFWDQAADGQGFAQLNGVNLGGTASPGARLLNVWL
ncbi:carbon-nitrogen hydrolase family protein, partial [Pseudomonas frederiksbergensis]|nr:carbon-nitrogen hydrolase family protein [Pseudomonas frederiksbergensis]